MPQQPLDHIPSSTYRLQFNREFTLEQAEGLLDYLDELGIGACYASPLLKARPQSLHGYDIIDHSVINPEVGTSEQFEHFAQRLRERGLGLLLDMVPNHMCIADPGNRWWMNVLENGPNSPFARYFDIDWHPPKPDLANKILLPILGDQYGRVLENQEIRVGYEAGAFSVQYYEMRLPLEPRSCRAILEPVLASVTQALGESDERVLELASTITALRNLPSCTKTNLARVKERQREKEIVKRRLAALVDGSNEIRDALWATLEKLNGKKGDPRSFDALEALLSRQAFRLSSWRVAADEINYRRFFDINDLAAIRVEEPDVFAAVHELVFELLKKGLVTGLRIDHVDGLLDPRQYLERIKDYASFVVVEKILTGSERLNSDWPVAGTTGYDFLNLLNGLFVDGRNRRAMLAVYQRYTGSAESFDEVLYASKKVVLTAMMSSELHVLARKLDRLSEHHRWSRDFTFNSLQQALTEVIACFPVYRSYVGLEDMAVSEEDRRHISTAIRQAKRRNPSTSATIFDFIASILLLHAPEGLSQIEVLERRDFVARFQQLTSPVMAKGLEDTAFYRFYPLTSLCEVGGGGQPFGVSISDFHRSLTERRLTWPHGLSATATHDTKRGEDVRARINVLSELPEEWEQALLRWHVQNLSKRRQLEGREVPSLDEEYLLYQTLLGAWPVVPLDEASRPVFVRRIQDYMIKALKEAKINTSWINPDEEYEQELRSFVAAVLEPAPDNAFLAECAAFAGRIARAGMWNSLSQSLLKITAPGVPDFYQGTELWDLSLVDPDNRRPVDYGQRRALLSALRYDSQNDPLACCARLLGAPEDGRIKLYVLSQALRFRRANAELFRAGTYDPLAAAGEAADHVIAFARSLSEKQVVVVATRFFMALGAPDRPPVGPEVWRSTRLPLPAGTAPGVYRDCFTGRSFRIAFDGDGALELAEVLAHLPVALLARVKG